MSIGEGKDPNVSRTGSYRKIHGRAIAKVQLFLERISARPKGLSESNFIRPSVLDQDAAFNPSLVGKYAQRDSEAATRSSGDAMRSFRHGISDPKSKILNKFTKTTAGQLSKVGGPSQLRKVEADLVHTHDHLRAAEVNVLADDGKSLHKQDDLKESKNQARVLEAHRESLQIAWITRQYVKRVRVVATHRSLSSERHFTHLNTEVGKLRDWIDLIGHYLLLYAHDFSVQYIDDFDTLPFSIQELKCHVERLVVASAPWQIWLMHVRSVYRWEQPATTLKWLAIFSFLWYTEHVAGCFFGYIIYTVVRNRIFPTVISDMRDSIDRARDSQSRAHKFGELISKHGRHDWLEPIIDKMGPQMQLQANDLANMLEVLSNFYNWRNPRMTSATLVFFCVCIMISILTDTAFCIKIIWFVFGSCFFLCWPIASLYPKYRYLVSPFKWIFWNIPTNAEWAFQYLRCQAQLGREEIMNRSLHARDEVHTHKADGCVPAMAGASNGLYDSKPEFKALPYHEGGICLRDSDHTTCFSSADTYIGDQLSIQSFAARYKRHHGHLVLLTDSVRFLTRHGLHELWQCSFLQISEIEKTERPGVLGLTSAHLGLDISITDGVRSCFWDLQDRDEAFNAILAFSGCLWQSLQGRMPSTPDE